MSARSRRILLACYGSYGDVYPYIGLAIALKARGHSPIVAAPEFYRAAVEQEAIAFSPIGPDADPSDRELIARVMHPVNGSEHVIRDLMMPALEETYEGLQQAAHGADVLVSHPLTFPVSIIAEQRGLPWAATVLAPLSLFSATDLPVLPPPPWTIHLPRFGRWFGRLVIGLGRRGLGRAVIGIGRRATREWVEPVQQLRTRLGLPRSGHPLFEGQFSPALNLALFSHVLAEPQADWPPQTETTGFVFYNGRGTLDPGLETFLRGGSPPVVFTLGTSAVGAAGRFYEESVEAVRRLGVRAVVLTGGFAENQPAGALPPGVVLVDRAPHQLLFPHASAIVHQGGIGTTAQALRSGHPMLVVPHGHDQPDNAYRVTKLGVARTIAAQDYRATRVTPLLEELLVDRSCHERAAAVAETVREEGGAETAAELIDQRFAGS